MSQKSKQQKIEELQTELAQLKRDAKSSQSCINYLDHHSDGFPFCPGCAVCHARNRNIELIEEKLDDLDPIAKYGKVRFLMEPARRGGKPYGFHWGIEASGPKGSIEVEAACETLEEATAQAKEECKRIGRELPKEPGWSGTKPKLEKRKYGTVLKGQVVKVRGPVRGRASKLSVS